MVVINKSSPLYLCTARLCVGLNGKNLPPQTFERLCNALADRRRRLAELAERVLTSTEYAELVSSNHGLLDSKSREVFNSISDRGCPIPSALQVSSKSSTVYHRVHLKPEEMSKLWDAGFRDIDTINSLRATPFMLATHAQAANRSVSVCKWLISKGADPLREVSSFSSTQIHYFAAGMAFFVLVKLRRLHKDSPERALSRAAFANLEYGVRFIIRGSSLVIQDQCQCGCSIGGCSPLHLLLKYTLADIY
jgi:hypothetical protein